MTDQRDDELRIDILGSPVVTLDGAPLAVDTRKAVAVLAVLAVTGSTGRAQVPRSELADLLWPDGVEGRTRAALRRTLSVLLAATGPAVAADRDSVSLVTAHSDVVTFRALARSTERADLARAVGLVRGELLAGFTFRDAPAFDEWVARESDALRRELGGVLERLVLARLQHGELHAGLADAARWLDLDPLHEPAHRSLMRMLAWTGRRQDALDQYQRCVRVLGDELGVAPVRATTDVYDAIRAGTLAPPRRSSVRTPAVTVPPQPPQPTQPPDSVRLVGRAHAVATLDDALGHGNRVVVVTGEGGIGRSRLVEEFAARAAPAVLVRAHGGEAALSFALITDLVRAAIAVGRPLPAELAATLARVVPEVQPAGRALEPPLSSPGARDLFFDAVVRVLAGSGARAIVVEDVHEAGPASAALLAYLVHRVERLSCPLVLTWRDPGLGERHPLRRALGSGEAGPRAARTTTITLARLTRAEIAELAGSDHTVDVDALWRDTAGLPLLVVAALHGLRDSAPDTSLDARSASLPAAVRDVFAARLAAVSEETGQVLGALAVLGGIADPGDLPAASGRSEDETVEAVEEALRAGLVREEGDAIAFTHEVLRRVAYDGLSLVRRRLLHHRAATTLAARRDSHLFASAVATHLQLAGRHEEAVDWAWRAAQRSQELFAHEEALHALDLAAALGRDDASVALARGDALVALARYDEARVALGRALAHGGPDRWRAGIERRLADLSARVGEWPRAAAGLDAALDLAGDDDALRARLWADRAVIAVRSGDGTAAAAIERALAVAPRADPYVGNVRGVVALDDQDPAAAAEHFRQALDLVTAGAPSSDPALEAAIRNNLATAQAAAGDPRAAVITARAALDLGERLGDRHRLAALHANLADRLHEIGDAEGALVHLKHSAALFAEVGADSLDRPDVWTLTVW